MADTAVVRIASAHPGIPVRPSGGVATIASVTATIEDVFWAAHEGLPREAPGSPATTELLLRLAGPLPGAPRIVDIGCGTGPATPALAAATGG